VRWSPLTLADSKGELSVNMIGWRGLARLGKGTPVHAEMSDRMRQISWLREQELWSRDSEPLASSRRFTQDFVTHGEWEAILRHADRVHVWREPPTGWQSRYPVVPWLAY